MGGERERERVRTSCTCTRIACFSREGDNVYVFQMSKLVPYLKEQASKNVAPYHNLQALKYEVSGNRFNI